jgi:hypothetical protein
VSYTADGDIADLFSPELARDCVRELADAAGAAVTATARELAPIDWKDPHHPPGSLRDSYVQMRVELMNDGVNAGYTSGVESHDYRARWIEWGTKAHPEDPKRRRAIEFTTIDGVKVRAHIRNPGIPAQHVVARALALAELSFDEIAQPALDRWKQRQEAAAHR